MLHRLPSALECLPDTSRRGQRCRVRAVRDLWVAWHACLRRRSPFGPFGGWARDGSRACRPCAPLPPLSHAIVCHGIVRRPDALVSTCTPDAASGLTSPRLLRDAQKPARGGAQQITPTAPPPPHLPPPHAPRGQQVHPTSTRRGGAVVVAVVGARQSRLSGWAAWSSTRVRGCEHAGCERRSVADDARNRSHICILHFSLRPWQRLSLHDAWVEYEPHPHGPSGERRFRLVETWCRGIFQRGLPTDPAPVALVGGPHRSRTAGTPPQFAFGGRLLLLRRVTALRLPKWAEMRRRRDLEFAVWSGPGGENRNSVSARLPSSNPVTRDARGGGLGPRNEAADFKARLEVPRRPASLTCTGDRGAGGRRSKILFPTKPADQAR